MTRRVRDRELLAYLEGEVTASEAAAIEAELADPACRRRLEALRELVSDLGAASPAIDAVDLVADVRANLASATPIRGRSRRAAAIATVCAVAAAAAAGVAVVGSPSPLPAPAKAGPDEAASGAFRAKAGSTRTGDRWVELDVYRVGDGEAAAPEPLGRALAAGDGLLFAYRNAAEPAFSYLMVFAVGAGGEVRWYYPAYERAGSDPASIAIDATDVHALELPDLIHHDHQPGRLTLYGLFTHEPLRVSEVEAILGAAASSGMGAPPRLPVADSGQHRLAVEVTP